MCQFMRRRKKLKLKRTVRFLKSEPPVWRAFLFMRTCAAHSSAPHLCCATQVLILLPSFPPHPSSQVSGYLFNTSFIFPVRSNPAAGRVLLKHLTACVPKQSVGETRMQFNKWRCTSNGDVELLVFEKGGVNPKLEDIAINDFADQVGVCVYPHN